MALLSTMESSFASSLH
jgi:hypothetical protein